MNTVKDSNNINLDTPEGVKEALLDGNDLYNPETGEFWWLYNENDSIAQANVAHDDPRLLKAIDSPDFDLYERIIGGLNYPAYITDSPEYYEVERGMSEYPGFDERDEVFEHIASEGGWIVATPENVRAVVKDALNKNKENPMNEKTALDLYTPEGVKEALFSGKALYNFETNEFNWLLDDKSAIAEVILAVDDPMLQEAFELPEFDLSKSIVEGKVFGTGIIGFDGSRHIHPPASFGDIFDDISVQEGWMVATPENIRAAVTGSLDTPDVVEAALLTRDVLCKPSLENDHSRNFYWLCDEYGSIAAAHVPLEDSTLIETIMSPGFDLETDIMDILREDDEPFGRYQMVYPPEMTLEFVFDRLASEEGWVTATSERVQASVKEQVEARLNSPIPVSLFATVSAEVKIDARDYPLAIDQYGKWDTDAFLEAYRDDFDQMWVKAAGEGMSTLNSSEIDFFAAVNENWVDVKREELEEAEYGLIEEDTLTKADDEPVSLKATAKECRGASEALVGGGGQRDGARNGDSR